MACISRIFSNSIKTTKYRSLHQRIRFYSSSAKDKSEEDEFDKPIKFSTSNAATWKAEYSFSGSSSEKENDVDEKLALTLYDHVDGMEEVQIRNAINYYKEHEKNYDTSKLEKRLEELLLIKNKR